MSIFQIWLLLNSFKGSCLLMLRIGHLLWAKRISLYGIGSIRSLSLVSKCSSSCNVRDWELLIKSSIPRSTLCSSERFTLRSVIWRLWSYCALCSERELLTRVIELGTLFLVSCRWLRKVISYLFIFLVQHIINRLCFEVLLLRRKLIPNSFLR